MFFAILTENNSFRTIDVEHCNMQKNSLLSTINNAFGDIN